MGGVGQWSPGFAGRSRADKGSQAVLGKGLGQSLLGSENSLQEGTEGNPRANLCARSFTRKANLLRGQENNSGASLMQVSSSDKWGGYYR